MNKQTSSSLSLTHPFWTPNNERLNQSLLKQFQKEIEKKTGRVFKNYDELHQWSIDNLEEFWSYVWEAVSLIGQKGPAPYLEKSDSFKTTRFFPHAKLNYTENILRKKDQSPALIFRSEGNFKTETISWADLYDEVSRFAQGLRKIGLKKGDRVCGIVPNTPEAIIALLACASLGAIWASASPDFGIQGILDRFGQVQPKVLIAVDGYYYNGKRHDCLPKLKEIIKGLPSLEKTVVISYAGSDLSLSEIDAPVVSYESFIKDFTSKNIVFERFDFNYPLFIMFSSGTTGIPKCLVHGTGGTLLQHLKEHQLHCDIKPQTRVFYFTTCGWMMWNWLVSALASQAVVLLYDGSPFYPDGYALWNFAEKEQCAFFGTAAKYIDALKKQHYEPGRQHDLSSIQTLASTGSPLLPESFDYIQQSIKKDMQIASISGGTDIISCFVLGNLLSSVYRGEIQGPGLGMAVKIFDENQNSLARGQGELVCTKPFPSMPVRFWNDDQGIKYHQAYFDRFENIWCHGDWVERTENGGFIIHGRSDATLNPGGVRIGTAEIYRQVEKLPYVVESIAVGQDWEGDVRIILFVTLKENQVLTDALITEMKTQIRNGSSPRHVPAKIIQVTDIPRTKSGKITELAVRHIIHNRPVQNTEALANPESLEQFKGLKQLLF